LEHNRKYSGSKIFFNYLRTSVPFNPVKMLSQFVHKRTMLKMPGKAYDTILIYN